MSDLVQGSHGAEVQLLQARLIELGFLAGAVDGSFGPVTAQAVRDLQRRLLLLPDGVVGPRTRAGLAAALAAQPPFPTSPYRDLVEQGQSLAAQGKAGPDHLPLLDRGLPASPLRSEPPRFPARLAAGLPAAQLVPYPDPAGTFSAYPAHGVVPPIVSGSNGRGGLEFLSDEVAQACLCIGSFAADQPLRVRWYGRRALQDNVQFWSATKFVAPLQVVCQANRRSPGTPIRDSRVRSGDGSASAPFAQLFTEMVSYAQGVGRSNAIGYLFKQLLNSGEPDVQAWLRGLSGNPSLTLLGRYGVEPLYRQAVLSGPSGVLVGHRALPVTRNLVSAYDLVRIITLLGWHHQLPQGQRLPGAQWASLATLVEGLGHDTARYLDEALERLGLPPHVQEPVILSKLGYGDSAPDHPDAPAFTYVAFASFRDARTAPARQRCFALALRVPTGPGLNTALRHDARMAAEVTEIVRRVFAEEFG
jgi:hypothetical protein